jgi:hypothetical protein
MKNFKLFFFIILSSFQFGLAQKLATYTTLCSLPESFRLQQVHKHNSGGFRKFVIRSGNSGGDESRID